MVNRNNWQWRETWKQRSRWEIRHNGERWIFRLLERSVCYVWQEERYLLWNMIMVVTNTYSIPERFMHSSSVLKRYLYVMLKMHISYSKSCTIYELYISYRTRELKNSLYWNIYIKRHLLFINVALHNCLTFQHWNEGMLLKQWVQQQYIVDFVICDPYSILWLYYIVYMMCTYMYICFVNWQ